MKYLQIVFIIILIFSITINIVFFKSKIIAQAKNDKINNNMLSMMVENDKGNYELSKDNKWPEGYVLNETLSKCEKGSTLKWNNDTRTITLSTNKTDKCYVYFDKYNYTKECLKGKNDSFACEIIKLAQTDETIIYHNLADATAKGIENANLVADDDSYRYSGASSKVNNYVCFGTDECNESTNYNNLYRIIGVFKNEKTNNYEVKLIKADYVSTNETGDSGAYSRLYIWKSHSSMHYLGLNEQIFNTAAQYRWDVAQDYKNIQLNVENLNNYYLNTYLGNGQNYNINPNKWQKMIVSKKWYTSATDFDSMIHSNAKNAFENEIVNKNNNDTTDAPIGLMYVSDYYYAADNNYWNLPGTDTSGSYNSDTTIWTGNDYSLTESKNWMFMGLYEWTISYSNTQCDFTGNCTYIIRNCGFVTNLAAISNTLRPSFYIDTNVKLASGDGTISNPYKLKLD